MRFPRAHWHVSTLCRTVFSSQEGNLAAPVQICASSPRQSLFAGRSAPSRKSATNCRQRLGKFEFQPVIRTRHNVMGAGRSSRNGHRRRHTGGRGVATGKSDLCSTSRSRRIQSHCAGRGSQRATNNTCWIQGQRGQDWRYHCERGRLRPAAIGPGDGDRR